MQRIRRVLYASDFSTASRRAFSTAIMLANSLDARLIILHVLAPVTPTVPEQFIDAVTIDRLEEQMREWAARQLTRLARAATKAGVTSRTMMREGDAVREITRAARATRANLIVVGTHGRRGLPKLFLGSVAERVVATASCPVVTVRGA